MALRLRRDVQKASYYVWFLGAEEAKGLRGSRIINSVLPYLIDRSRGQEPLKVTLQVSHKGIKILQGSSKHFIPHSAITSSVQTDDIVACVLLLYNPATKCPLHVHAYRCDSESTAEALHQQLQLLINRPENQRRFEELETRLGIMPPMPATAGHKASAGTAAHAKTEHSQPKPHPYQSHPSHQQQPLHRRLESSPKRFSSSLGSDTGNSTRESECSEEHSGSPVSRSPPLPKPLQPNSELFDSLAAELRAKLNGNGPPILLPPRDYDTVHRSKGNLAAIELRRCRNKLIVGSTHAPSGPTQPSTTSATAATTGVGVKQVSSRGSSGIGSDLAPSPERQDLNSSSDDERWSNEADNSVIALKPSQIIAHHPPLNRKSAAHPPEDGYLRDLPAKPYSPHAAATGRPQSSSNAGHSSRDKLPAATNGSGSGSGNQRSKAPAASPAAWTREDEIKPIIMRPADYDAKFNRVLQAEQKQDYHRSSLGRERPAKLQDTDKYNEINRLLNKKHARDSESPERHRYGSKAHELDDFDESDPSSDNLPLHAAPPTAYRKENLTDKQKFIEYAAQKPSKTYAPEEPQRYGGRHRYVDPAELPFEQPTLKKYGAAHRGAASPERSDLGHRTAERQRERPRTVAEDGPPRRHSRDRDRDRERERYSRSNERNPYREPESIPYIESMEKMMKSTALCYKAYEGSAEASAAVLKSEPGAPGAPGAPVAPHAKVSQRSTSYPKHEDDARHDYTHARSAGRSDYAPSAGSGSHVTPKERFKDAKNKFHAMEKSDSRYDLNDEKEGIPDYKPRRHGSAAERTSVDIARVYEDWSDEERLNGSSPPPPVAIRTASRSREHWEQPAAPIRERERERERDMLPPREQLVREREPRDRRDYSHDVRARELPGMRPEPRDVREPRDHRYDHHDMPPRTHERDASRANLTRDHQRSDRARDRSRDYAREQARDYVRDQSRDYGRDHAGRRDYTPERRVEPLRSNDYVDRSMEKQRVPHPSDKYPPPPPPTSGGAPLPNAKVIASIPKGYRHSYAEPVFARTGGRVGLAAVNPF